MSFPLRNDPWDICVWIWVSLLDRRKSITTPKIMSSTRSWYNRQVVLQEITFHRPSTPYNINLFYVICTAVGFIICRSLFLIRPDVNFIVQITITLQFRLWTSRNLSLDETSHRSRVLKIPSEIRFYNSYKYI